VRLGLHHFCMACLWPDKRPLTVPGLVPYRQAN